MSHLLIRGADTVLTMDPARGEFSGDIRLRDGVIAELGHDLPPNGAEILDARGWTRFYLAGCRRSTRSGRAWGRSISASRPCWV